jgi:hypothetical protein
MFCSDISWYLLHSSIGLYQSCDLWHLGAWYPTWCFGFPGKFSIRKFDLPAKIRGVLYWIPQIWPKITMLYCGHHMKPQNLNLQIDRPLLICSEGGDCLDGWSFVATPELHGACGTHVQSQGVDGAAWWEVIQNHVFYHHYPIIP